MYNNPYMMRPSLLSRGINWTRGINWSGLLEGTQKTLGVVNQAIPIVYQIKPIFNNARTLFKIADSMRGSVEKTSNNTNSSSTLVEEKNNTNQPIFYI